MTSHLGKDMINLRFSSCECTPAFGVHDSTPSKAQTARPQKHPVVWLPGKATQAVAGCTGDFIKAGSDIISVHAEQSSTIHLHRVISQARSLPPSSACKGPGLMLDQAPAAVL